MSDSDSADNIELVKTVVEESLRTTVTEVIPTKLGGAICYGIRLLTGCGQLFVKVLRKPHPQAETLFTGEAKSLETISATNTVCVPRPIKVTAPKENLDYNLVLEYLDMSDISPTGHGKLGEQIARLHLDNLQKLALTKEKEASLHRPRDVVNSVEQFGFHVPTCNGYFVQDNSWHSDWGTFFLRNKLQPQADLVVEQFGDRDLLDIWPQFLQKLDNPSWFGSDIQPSLLHGDLHEGNVSVCGDVPVVYDPSSFYGHHEFDLAMASLFGGFSPEFWSAYHCLIPRSEGFEGRQRLYHLQVLLNHWNHFGPTGFRNWKRQALDIVNGVINDSS